MVELAKKELCTGCSACVSACKLNCIEMVEDVDGFSYPKINYKKCVNCMECVNHCPICNNNPNPFSNVEAYAAFTKNDKLRQDSSSGGIFSELAIEILRKGGIVFGAAYDSEFNIIHTYIETEDQLYRLRGAKYAQSSLNECFCKVENLLKQKRIVLFSGTPCQITGLKSFLRIEYEGLLCVDFVCHGVSSPKVWNSFVKYRKNIDNDGKYPISINMRSKDTGWSKYKYSNKFQYKDKEWKSLSSESIYMKLFVKNYINRLSCENCSSKGFNRASDITLGDFWGIWEIYPDLDDNCGTSLLLLNSKKGKYYFNNIKERLKFKAVSLQEASFMNPSILESSKPDSKRSRYIKLAVKGDFDRLSRKIKRKEKISIITLLKDKIGRLFKNCN